MDPFQIFLLLQKLRKAAQNSPKLSNKPLLPPIEPNPIQDMMDPEEKEFREMLKKLNDEGEFEIRNAYSFINYDPEEAIPFKPKVPHKDYLGHGRGYIKPAIEDMMRAGRRHGVDPMDVIITQGIENDFNPEAFYGNSERELMRVRDGAMKDIAPVKNFSAFILKKGLGPLKDKYFYKDSHGVYLRESFYDEAPIKMLKKYYQDYQKEYKDVVYKDYEPFDFAVSYLKLKGMAGYNSQEKKGNDAYRDDPTRSFTFTRDRSGSSEDSKEAIYRRLIESDSAFMNFYNETLKKIDSELPKYQKGSKMQSLPLQGKSVEKDSILEKIYSKYPVLRKLEGVQLKADTTFTKEKTGIGDIEFFGPDTKIVTYQNNYQITNPNPSGFGIVYNPHTNNEQTIMLDMLHGLKDKDSTYAQLRQNFGDTFLKRHSGDYRFEWEEQQKEPNDGEEQFKQNWIDGQIRGLLYEGSDEDFIKHNYWKEARNTYLKDKDINAAFGQLKNYLKSDPNKVKKHQKGNKILSVASPHLKTYHLPHTTTDNTAVLPAINPIERDVVLKRQKEKEAEQKRMQPPTSLVPESERILDNTKQLGRIVGHTAKPVLQSGAIAASMVMAAPQTIGLTSSFMNNLALAGKTALGGGAMDYLYQNVGGQLPGDILKIKNPVGNFLLNTISPGMLAGTNTAIRYRHPKGNLSTSPIKKIFNFGKEQPPTKPFNSDEEAMIAWNKWYRPNLTDEQIDDVLMKEYGYGMKELNDLVTNNSVSTLDGHNMLQKAILNQSEGTNTWVDLETILKSPKNKSGVRKIAMLKDPDVGVFDKIKLKILPNEMYRNTVVLPNKTIKRYSSTDKAMRELNSVEHISLKQWVKDFNSNLKEANNIIRKNNVSGTPYSIMGLKGLNLENQSAIMKFRSPKGISSFDVVIDPGKTKSKVANIFHEEYYKSFPGLRVVNAIDSVFPDGPSRGTKTYKSINDYLSLMNLGVVKSGFNTQTNASRQLWEKMIREGKAIGYVDKNKKTIYGMLKNNK